MINDTVVISIVMLVVVVVVVVALELHRTDACGYNSR